MDVQESVSNQGNGKEKADQERVETGQEEDGPLQFEKVIQEIDHRSSNGHGDDSKDEVFDLKFLSGDSRRPEGLDQILNAPKGANAPKERNQSNEDQKDQRFVQKKSIIEDAFQLPEPFDVDLEGKEKCHQDRYRHQIQGKTSPPLCPPARSFEGKNKREVEEKQGGKREPCKDHLHSEDRMNRVRAADHDDFAYVPGGKGKDKAGKEPMSHTFGFTGKHDETQGEVHRKGKCSRKCQDVH
jgi:hypothetical protein